MRLQSHGTVWYILGRHKPGLGILLYEDRLEIGNGPQKEILPLLRLCYNLDKDMHIRK